MFSEDQLEACGRILEILDHGAYRAELANGHICTARPLKQQPARYEIGQSVRLSFHPADLSRARLPGLIEA